ncbi:probable glycosyltransferase At3g07620 isoform X3 [Cucurbita maxima]|uniref:Probable glycosyltransferase At3g07620 isoform X3 n=1 Tax=Cucurbita maxima TaxID=3661 RepID=A0A6J1HPI6_CUCMA|nr:probable glycosyltransferase At3g07620 isoform X3 [Cucurbita maxima]
MEIRRLLIIIIMILITLFSFQYSVFQYTKSLNDKASTHMMVQNVCHMNNLGLCRFDTVDTGINNLDTKETVDYDTNKKVRKEVGDLTSEFLKKESFDEEEKSNLTEDTVIRETNAELSYSPLMKGDVLEDSNMTADEDASAGQEEDARSSMEELENDDGIVPGKKDSVVLNDRKGGPDISTLSGPFISISQMYSKLSRAHKSSCLKQRRQCPQTSRRDRELHYARREIENSSVLRSTPGINGSIFRNISIFTRSYELMEKMLKVYIYEEGEKPIFHQPILTGIYASEGWFMKLLEENKKFTVKDPEKAHLFYLPFSSQFLRVALGNKFRNKRDLQKLLRKYIDLIGKKYPFWKRNGGSDHFLVACHDWAPKLTKRLVKNCIRALCNANAAADFEIGKDTSLPVTFVHSIDNPIDDIGGKPPSERTTLAFFAGSMHGYLRPILLHYWENKEPDMMIVGPMPNSIEGKSAYMKQMKSSKYCICARGYQVHTPRVIEAILNECIPVIISDNYVPPFFEVLNWESFSVFVKERDIPNLRDILLSIPEENYLAMHSRVKMVQQHFLWHEKPAKYDAFHMILHSIWYTRVFEIKTN